MNDPHLAARGSIGTIQYGAGDYRLPNPPFQIPGVPTHVQPQVPEFDEHAKEVLQGVLGYTEEQVLACRVKRTSTHA